MLPTGVEVVTRSVRYVAHVAFWITLAHASLQLLEWGIRTFCS